MKLIFMGSPAFALPALKAVLAAGHDVVAAYTQPPRPSGRGQKVQNTPVHDLALAHNIPVHTPKRLKDEALDELLQIECDAIVVVAYGLLLPQAVLDHAPCLNIHPSALPRWRGPAPLQHTLWAGDVTTQVCVMGLDAGMDTGPVYMRQDVDVPVDMTLGMLHDMTAEVGAELLVQVLENLHQRTPVPQVVDGVTLAPKIAKDMRPLDWGQSAVQVHNQIRAMSPFPAATMRVGDEVWKVLQGIVLEEKNDFAAGEILGLNDEIKVACGEGVIALTKVQRPGKPVQDAADVVQVLEQRRISRFF